MIAGRNFSRDFPSDTLALILNETAVQWMGFADAEKALGQQVNYWDVIYTVIGVMKDYHQQSPKAAFEPHLYRLLPYGRGVRGRFTFRLNTQEPETAVKKIQQSYEQYFPDNPFEFFFLDDYFNQQYKADVVVGNVLGIFSLLAVFVTSLGIFGLFSFLVIQRTKEISIRNILGSGIPRILLLFGREFLLLILTAFALSLVGCYIGINQWLNSFANRMPITAWLFILPLLLVIVVAGLTISSQIIKVARTNPVDNLRYE
jgi:putative ABC transport system permease protein